MDIRLYEPRDRASCLDVFDSLMPDLLDSTMRPLFNSWLDRPDGPYFVMEHEDSIAGCGGYSLSPDHSVATLQWGMVRRSFHRMGFGRFLLLYRIRETGKAGTAGVVVAQAPHPSAGFFEKQGFRVNGIEKDAYTPGMDRIELVKKLTVCP